MMSEVTMLSRMVACGLICTFQCNGTIERDIMLTVRISGRSHDHYYVCEHALGTSKLIALAWNDWESYCTDREIDHEIGPSRRWATNQADE